MSESHDCLLAGLPGSDASARKETFFFPQKRVREKTWRSWHGKHRATAMASGSRALVLEEELLAIEAIYPGSVVPLDGSENTFALSLDQQRQHNHVLYITFDLRYPQSTPHLSGVSSQVDKHELNGLLNGLRGSEVLYPLLSFLHEKFEDAAATVVQSPTPTTESPSAYAEWFIGETIHDRKSSMLGRACRAYLDNLDLALQDIDGDKRLQKASHPKIWVSKLLMAVSSKH